MDVYIPLQFLWGRKLPAGGTSETGRTPCKSQKDQYLITQVPE